MGTASAWILSAFVPPGGMGCRQIAESSMMLIWLLSFTMQYLVSKWATQRKHQKRAFRIIFIKDIVPTKININSTV
jgi:hypothetical protein